MSLPSITLKKAVRDALLADGALSALVGINKVFDEAPRDAVLPYLVFGEILTRDASTSSGRAHETTLVLQVLSGQGGQREAHAIAAQVELILHDAVLSLIGHRLVNLTFSGSETRRERSLQTTRATLRFRAYTEQL
jgi:hypothetical protein